MQLVLSITPSGRIVCESETNEPDDGLPGVAIDDTVAAGLLDAFRQSTSSGLLQLAGIGNKTTSAARICVLAQLGSAISESRLTTG